MPELSRFRDLMKLKNLFLFAWLLFLVTVPQFDDVLNIFPAGLTVLFLDLRFGL